MAVVGGGIAGLQTAYTLVREGLRVALVESGRIIEDVTGYTTGKLTSQHGLIYQHLIESLGPQKAKIYAQANQSAIGSIAGIIEENAVDCDFQPTAAYLFCEREENLALLKAEAKAARHLGLPATFVEETPLYYAYGAVRFDDQARWHPRKYLMFLSGGIAVAGGYILENTRALDIVQEGKKLMIKTAKGALRARSVVIATNAPFYRREIFAPLLSPTRSYVLGLRLADPAPDGLFYAVDGTGASMRTQPVGEEMIFMVGGWDKNLPGHETDKQYELVESYARERFNIDSIDYHWFTQDQKTPDQLPLVGLLPGSKNIYIATGFNGWGMTTSHVAAGVITDLIAGRQNPAAALFDPGRLIK